MYKMFFKRFLDVLLSLLGLLFFILITIFIAALIKREDHGSVFYNAERLGKNGRVFKMYKFRTMKVNAPDLRNPDGSTFNSKDDPRLTRIGRFLRKSSLDETPQLLNILKGDMSFIGPRPDLPEHISAYTAEESRKLDVLPGITGYNQAYYRNSVDWKERIQNDLYYIDHMRFWLDVKIGFKTVASVFKSDGVFGEPDSGNAVLQYTETVEKEYEVNQRIL